jgi:hypothetical protein
MKTKKRKIFPIEKQWSRKLFPRDLATGHFSGKFLLKIAGSSPDDSNDTGLKFVWRPGTEPIECL